ncbi:MAG: translation elongation factor Ts [Candidatus Pacebacteria bacterium]|jgi:elongation factor Ts|nr:translation elongation factor Ts [Candidatus Paceibacterota bacterium]
MSSSTITTELVKELRDKTGISVMQCRKALEEAQGDMEKAIAILKKTSSDIALKKQDRVAADGRVTVKTAPNKAFIVSLHCETDFVSKNDDFVNLLETLATKAVEGGIEAMKVGAKDMIDPIIQKTGEKIELGEAYEVDGAVIGTYVHNNKAAVVVSLEGGTSELAKDIAMHIAAMRPEYLSASEIDEAAKKTMTEIFEKEVAGVDKPEEIKKKMLEGKIGTYFKEKTLIDQPFIKNPEETIGSLLQKSKSAIKEVKRYSI